MLQKFSAFPGVPGPVVVIVMDGYGLPKHDVGSAIAAARKPTLDRLFAEFPHISLRAHGIAVGMPSDDDMGNSEVGHNAIGAGQVYSQGAALVANAIADGSIWQGQAWQQIVAGAKAGRGVIHFIGLFSDGNVHSHIDHLKAMVVQAKLEGVKTVRIHALLDGRDVPETSALDYVVPFEAFLVELSIDGFDARIASGGGRQNITMDRYDANWPMVEKGWKTHVLGQGPQFANATAAVNGLRAQHPGTIDQDLPEFVIAEAGQPIGTVEDGDSVVFYNFRGDRAIEITRAFVEQEFSRFDRVRTPDVTFAGMLHMTVHSLTKSAIFFAVGHAVQKVGTQKMEDIRGLIRHTPTVGWGLTIGTLAILGMPPFGVFASEFLIITTAMHTYPWTTPFLLVALGVAFAAVFSKVQPMVFGEPNETKLPHPPALIPVFAHLGLVLMLGLYITPYLADWYRQAAALIG